MIQKFLTSTMAIAATSLFYILIIALGISAITTIQIRQNFGTNLEVLVSMQALEEQIAKYTDKTLNLSKAGALESDPNKSQQLSADAAEYMGRAELARRELDALRGRVKRNLGSDEKVDLAKNNLLAISPFLQMPLISFLAKMPTDINIFILAISMGAVGGVLSVMKDFLEATGNIKPVSRYFINPILGAIVSIAVFVLFKAGQIVISFGGNAEGQFLNPFLIAFLGIISGLVAKEAIARVELAGRTVFSSKEEESRQYALQTLKAIAETIDDNQKELLARATNLSEKTLEDIFGGRRPATDRQADMIAIFFHQPRTALFNPGSERHAISTTPKS